jgi:mono/diheme cytochrome c family protein
MLRCALLFISCFVARCVGAQALSPFEGLKARTLLDRSLPCMGCHTLDGAGGHVGPDLSTVRARRTAQYIAAMIDDPQRVVPGTAMPRTPLTPPTRALLVRLLGGTPGSAPPRPAISPPDAGEVNGARSYARWCASCHGAQGGGDGPNARFLPVRPAVHRDARLLSQRSDDQLFDAIASGGGAMGRSPRMPSFGATLAPNEIRALVAHLRTLCQCRAPAWSVTPHAAPSPH